MDEPQLELLREYWETLINTPEYKAVSKEIKDSSAFHELEELTEDIYDVIAEDGMKKAGQKALDEFDKTFNAIKLAFPKSQVVLTKLYKKMDFRNSLEKVEKSRNQTEIDSVKNQNLNK